MNYIDIWARERQRHISAYVRKARKHVKYRDQTRVGMVGDGLDWARVFNYRLYIGEREAAHGRM